MARAASALAREKVKAAQLAGAKRTSAIIAVSAMRAIHETIKRRVVWNKCGLVHLDGDAEEQREVVLHLRVRAGGIRNGLGRIPPPIFEGLLNQVWVSDV